MSANPLRMVTVADVDAHRAKYSHARRIINELCQKQRGWTMSIPPRPDDDPDLVISDALLAGLKIADSWRQQDHWLRQLYELLQRRGYAISEEPPFTVTPPEDASHAHPDPEFESFACAVASTAYHALLHAEPVG